MSKSQTATINWKKKYLPFKAKASLGGASGELTLTERALIFTPAERQSVGVDVEFIRGVKPDPLTLSITYSSAGEMKSFEFNFPEGDAKDAFRFARRILGLQPDVSVTGYKTISNGDFQKSVLRLMDLIRVREQIQDDLHTPEKLIVNELWGADMFPSWPQILWDEILAYHYYSKIVENIEKGATYNEGWKGELEWARKGLARAKNDLTRGELWPPPSFSSFPLE